MAVEIDANEVERLAGKGLTTKQIADCLGVARSTLYEHKKKNPDIADALKRGRSRGIEEVTNALYESAKGGNVTAQIFYLKNRDPERWQDRKHTDVNKTVTLSYDEAVTELLRGAESRDGRSAQPVTH